VQVICSVINRPSCFPTEQHVGKYSERELYTLDRFLLGHRDRFLGNYTMII